MKKIHAYTINWRDSAGLRGWRQMDPREFGVSDITSIGWLIHETKKEITITTSISEHGSAMDALTIPREAITRMRKIPNYVEDNTVR